MAAAFLVPFVVIVTAWYYGWVIYREHPGTGEQQVGR
jgi:hypothetical protein